MTNVEYFTGSYGLLVLPDAETRKKAARLGKLAPLTEYRVTARKAHITLFQGQLYDVPRRLVSQLRRDIEIALCKIPSSRSGLMMELGPIGVSYLTYLSWNLASIPGELMVAHHAACQLAVFRHQTGTSPASSSRQDLTRREKARQEDRQIYGYEDVGANYHPHVTLAADSTPLKDIKTEARHDAWADRVVFAEMGTWGSIKQIIPL